MPSLPPFALLSVLACLIVVPLAPAREQTVPVVGQGNLQSLTLLPASVVLRGSDQVQQLVVTGQYGNGGVRDLTAAATFRVADPSVVRVEKGGLLVALANGTTDLIATANGKTGTLKVTVVEAERERPIHFGNEIVPIFSKLGCNAGACHGKASGQNGFKLSLLGFEPSADYDTIVRETRGRRVLPSAPASSLLLLKATGAMPHGGGKRLDPGSRDYQLIERWIRAGTPSGSPDAPTVVGITITPSHRLVAPKATQQITVAARFSDGSQCDVTHQTEFSSNDAELATVGEAGLVKTADRPGEGAVMARYLGHVAVFRVTIPQEVPADRFQTPPPANFVDERVFARLRQLGLPPSDLCTDSEFLRRVSLDITGTLPTVAEVEQFLADPDPKKREKRIDDLLTRPAYASYFALKWGDILRNRRDGLVGVGGSQVRTTALHGWIRDSLAQNKPYDRFVREILTATGEFAGEKGQPPVAWYNVLRTPQALIDDTAQVFLGTRIQCAQCHHHPYEKWSQDDYWGLAAFFARVQLGKTPSRGKAPPTSRTGLPVVVAREGKVTSPQGKIYVNPRPLGGPELTIPEGQDPRERLADWMTRADNPFFARALVNRYWAHFLGRGLVEMPDDLRVTNPPSNPALLDALARDFVEHKYDLRHLIRTICMSRTYQLSSLPNEFNARDRQNFARFYPRRLPAEVLLDAIDQVAGVPTRFPGKTPATRAIELPDEAIKSPLLKAFGKPDRSSACECERSGAATLTQSLMMISSPEIHNKLKDRVGRSAKLAADPRPAVEKIRELYLLAYSRLPTAEEVQIAETFLAKAPAKDGLTKQQAAAATQWPYEDLLWVLLNTREFVFNH